MAIPKAYGQFYIGPKLGFQAYKSTFNFKEDGDIFDQKWKAGYQIGGTYDMPLTNIFNFAVELYFSKKGKKTTITDAGLTNDANYYFIEMPILLRFKFTGGQSPAGIINWHVDIGPKISYWLGGNGTIQGLGPTLEYKIKFGEPGGVTSFNTMYISKANRWQWGLNFGGGIEYPVVKQQKVYGDLRIGINSTNLAEFNGEAQLPVLGFADSMDVRFLEIALSVGYVFEIDYKQTRKGKSTDRQRRR